MRALMMKSCSGIAMAGALALAPQMAQAQSFDATGTFAFGTGNIATGFDETTVTVDTQSAVIDWTPNDNGIGGGDILFQAVATNAIFDGMGDYVVLNRINPADTNRAVRFEGLVTAFDDTGGIGGTVFFYSPGGIIIGQNALFDVGSLGLTTAEPLVDGNGDWFINDQVVFQQANQDSFVSIEDGVLSALEENSFIALFAPNIVQGGEIAVNGQAALVAGEAGTITFSPDGLFDIEVTVGSDSAGLEHNGITGGPQSMGPGDNHRVYMVAVPKANAIKMAIFGGSDIGFDVAGGAANDGDAVILSAGFNVSAGAPVEANTGGGGTVDLDIFSREMINSNPEPILFRSLTQGFASGRVLFDIGSDLFFDSDAEFFSNNRTDFIVRDINGSLGNAVVDGTLFLAADDIGLSPTGVDTQGASIDISEGASLSVGGDVIISARGGADSTGDFQAFGGQALFRISSGGSAQVFGDTILATGSNPTEFGTVANAFGGQSALIVAGTGSQLTVDGVTRIHSNSQNTGEQNARGGEVQLLIDQGGVYTTGELNILSSARVTDGSGNAGTGTASINVQGNDSVLTVLRVNETGDAMQNELEFIATTAIGGTPLAASVQDGGIAQAGNIEIRSTSGGFISLPGTATDPLSISQLATGGAATANDTSGGDADTRDLVIDIDNASATLGIFAIDKSASGGDAFNGLTNAAGGDGTTGALTIIAIGSSASLGIRSFDAVASGGDGSSDPDGRGGRANSGPVNITSTASDLTFVGDLEILPDAVGGRGGIGGPATGAQFNIRLLGNPPVSPNQVNVLGRLNLGGSAFGGDSLDPNGTISANAEALPTTFEILNSVLMVDGAISLSNESFGGNAAGAQAGDAIGREITLSLTDATIIAPSVNLRSFATGGFTGGNGATDGGNATAGNLLVIAEGGLNDIQSSLTINSRANGGDAAANGGDGGEGIGGSSEIEALAGASLDISGNVDLFIRGEGGDAAAGVGGRGDANGTQIDGQGDIAIGGNVRLSNRRQGGDGLTGGDVTGFSFAEIVANDATVTVTGVTTFETISQGGNALADPVAGGSGGMAQGDNIAILAQSGTTGGLINLSDVDIDMTITGGDGGVSQDGDGGDGGQADGGALFFAIESQFGELNVTGSTDIDITTTGGAGGSGLANGGDGGEANGLNFNIGAVSGGQFQEAFGSANWNGLNVAVVVNGGNGGQADGTGGVGGNALGGGGDLLNRGADISMGNVLVDVIATGGDGGAGATQGNGGFGATDGVEVIVSNNFNGITRGNLQTTSLTLRTQGFGGTGATPGLGFGALGGGIMIEQGDADLGVVQIVDTGLPPDPSQIPGGGNPPVNPIGILLDNAQLDVTNMSVSTLGAVVIGLEQSDFFAGGVTINAGTIDAEPAVMGEGQIVATNAISLISQSDLEITGLLFADNLVNLSAPGDIAIRDTDGGMMLTANAGGLLTVNGNLRGETIELISQDLAFAGGITIGAPDGVVSLVSSSLDGSAIGAGLDTSTGYVIDDAMLGQLNGQIINIVTADAANATIIVEDIDLALADNAQIINFTALGDGTVRIDGNVTSSALDPLDLGISAPLIQVNTDAGGIDLFDNGGSILLEGANLHVGEINTLDELLIGGLTEQETADLLATPTTISRPEGVLSAPELTFQLTEAILIQNTGTAEIPAGSLTTLDGSAIVIPVNNPQDVLVIINGQLDEPGGVLTGDEAATALIDFNTANNPNGFDGYAANSTFNGCPLTGCVAGPVEPEPPVVPDQQQDLTATVSAEVQVVNEAPVLTTPATSENAADIAADANLSAASGNDGGGVMGEPLAGEVDSGDAEEDFAFEEDPVIAEATDDEGVAEEQEPERTQEEEEAAEEATSGPIAPPVSLFRTTALENPVDVNDPVSSAGNPGLLNPDVPTPSADAGEAP